jgi:hypothetical protein
VAHNLVHFWGWGASLVSLPFVDKPWVLAFAGRDVAALFSLTVTGDRVSEIHVYAEPRALAFIRDRILPGGSTT